MPGPGIRLLGISLVSLLTGCSALNEAAAPVPSVSPAPTATATGSSWAESLAFSGDVAGQMAGIVASAPGQASECTGRASSSGGRWDSTLYGQVGQSVLGLVVTATPYRGPGSYAAPGTIVEVHSVDNQRVWRTQAGDQVTFVVNSDEESGTLDATLTNQLNNEGKLRVAGTWSCGR